MYLIVIALHARLPRSRHYPSGLFFARAARVVGMWGLPTALAGLLVLSAVLAGKLSLANADEQDSPVGDSEAKAERVASDTPWKTFAGNSFVVPAGWTVKTQGRGIVLEPPEGNSYVAIFDLEAPTADEAVGMAWKAYKPDAHWALFSTESVPSTAFRRRSKPSTDAMPGPPSTNAMMPARYRRSVS